jgi:hypothetical protein
MARISEAEIERLKSGISLQRLAEARGVRLKRHGADLLGLCPFHDDREPSLVISPEKNLWHCLGACQAGGTVIDWVMRAEAVSFRYAVELLRTEHSSLVAGSPAPADTRPVKKSTVQKLPTIAEQAHDDAEVFEHVVSYYQETLAASPEALGYLEKRGINHPEAVSRFRLGFANRTLAYRLPQKNRKTGAELRSQMQRLGVLRESGHEHLNGSLVIPVFDEQGRVTEMYGRKINENLREGTPRHLYLPGPHRGVWNESALAESKEVILCESLIDALTFWCAGFRNGRSPSRVSEARDRTGADRLRPRRSRRPRGGEASCGASRDGHRGAAGAVSEEHGREQLRLEGAAGGAELGPRAAEGRVDGGHAASGADGDRNRAHAVACCGCRARCSSRSDAGERGCARSSTTPTTSRAVGSGTGSSPCAGHDSARNFLFSC